MKAVLLLLGLIPLLAGAAPVKLNVDKRHSRLDIDVKATVDSFTGTLGEYEPAILIDDAGNVQSASFAFRFEDVKTGKAERDQQMHDWQQTSKYPDGVFKLVSIDSDAAGALSATGTLEFHGVQREISFPISITRDGPVLAIDGTVQLDTRDFGLPVIRKFLLLRVDPEVVVRFHMQGAPSQAPAKN